MDILIVDDDEDKAQLIEIMTVLQSKKIVCNEELIFHRAKDGIEGYEMYDNIKPDITFMDINMPRMNGIESIETIRDKDPEAYIVVITSECDTGVFNKCREVGATNVHSTADLNPLMMVQYLEDVVKRKAND